MATNVRRMSGDQHDDEDDPPVAYVESSVGAKYLEQPAERGPYEHVFGLLMDRSVRIEEWKR